MLRVARVTKAWSISATQTVSQIHAEVYFNWHRGKFSRFLFFTLKEFFLIFFRSVFSSKPAHIVFQIENIFV